MKNKLFMSLLLIFCFITCSYGKNVAFYMRIENPDFLPIEIISGSNKDIKVKTKKDGLNKVLSKYKIKQFKQAFPTAYSKWLRNIYYVENEDFAMSDELNEKFKGKITHIENLCEPMLCYTPNDYSRSINQSNLDLIQAKGAWSIARELPKIPIAVTDTYFETTHEDLKNQFSGVRGTNSESSSFHGTAVAGLLSAETDNNIGISSIGYNAKIYASTNWASDNEVLLLAQQGYRVINCSWLNSCSYSVIQDSLYSEIKNRWNAVVVFGAGNSTTHCGSLTAKVYPASLSSVLSVTSVGHIYSRGYIDPTYGKIEWIDCHEEVVGNPTTAHHHNDAVDICAPGYNVATTYAKCMNSGVYGGGWGTSFAAPQVAATVCLVLSVNPCLSAQQAMDIVVNSADTTIYSIPENAAYKGLLGHGRLDVTAAVTWAAKTATLIYDAPTTFSGSKIVKSNYAILTQGPEVKIAAGSAITFMARKEIELGAGFEVESNASFEAVVIPNNIITCQ